MTLQKKQWWKKWYEWDYSWDGLADKPWQGWRVVEDKAAYEAYLKKYGLPKGAPNEACRVIPADKIEKLAEGIVTREANLQDYWRDQEDILVECEGQKAYTNIHLPLTYADGTPTWKDDPDHEKWQTLTNLLTQRLERGIRTEVEIEYWDYEIVTGQEGRAQFCGGVLPALPSRLEPDQTHQDGVTGLNLKLFQAVITTSQNFSGTIFGSTFNAADAQFTGGIASFSRAQFTVGYVSFLGAQFTGRAASFNEAQFTGGAASFGGAQFTGGIASFSRAQFKIACDFENALFETQAKFVDTVFSPAKGSESAFRGTQFLGAVDFSRDNIEEATDEDSNLLPSSQTLFPFNAFENANIKDQIILSGLGDEDAQKEFDLTLASIDLACDEDAQDENLLDKTKKKESRYVALERGCTALKNAMEKTSDKNRAQRFFKFELLARQKRPSTSSIVSFMTDIYGLIADYGGSIGRPLATLFFVWLGFAVIYGVNANLFMKVRLDNSVNSFIGPLDFSLTHIFRPLFVWSNALDPSEGSWLYLYKERLPYWGWFLIKVLATIQSLASITLLFLFGLATKRKFQIS